MTNWFNPFRQTFGQLVRIHVKPKAKINSIKLISGIITVFVKALPEKNRSHEAVIALFKRTVNVCINIVKEHTTPIKRCYLGHNQLTYNYENKILTI